MGARMRATNHHGRIGTATHNGRCFDLSHAPHIAQARTSQNRYWFVGCGSSEYRKLAPDSGEYKEAFETSELRFYKQRFGRALKMQNDRYKADGHPERCRTMEQVLQTKNRQPVETILQIGDCDDTIDPAIFEDCVKEYIQRLREWSDEHHRCFFLINYAIHFDEASPHAHLRGTFSWTDENNIYHMGQEEALKQADVELPDPSKPRGRYNNRKMSFDRMLRDWWIEIAEAHGYEIEKEPIKGAVSLPVKAYKERQEALKDIDKERAALRVKQEIVQERSWKLAEKEAKLREEQEAVEEQKQRLEEAISKLEQAQAWYEEETKKLREGDGPLVDFVKKLPMKDGRTLWDVYQETVEKKQARRREAVKGTIAQAKGRDWRGLQTFEKQPQQDTGLSMG